MSGFDIDPENRRAYKLRNSTHSGHVSRFLVKHMKPIVLALVILVFLVIFWLATTRKELITDKTELKTVQTELKTVKFNIRDLTERGITLIAPSDPIFTRNRKTLTINPYSIVLKNSSNRPVVGYSI